MANGRLILMCVLTSCVTVCAGQAFAQAVEPVEESAATLETDCGECLPADVADLYKTQEVDPGEDDECEQNRRLAMGLSRQLAIEHARPSRGDVIGWTMIGLCTLAAGYGFWEEDWVLTGVAGACMAGGGAMVLVF
jgi:hypothetical protein